MKILMAKQQHSQMPQPATLTMQEIFSCVYDSGAGKSTLLQLLSGSKMAPSGSVQVLGEAGRITPM